MSETFKTIVIGSSLTGASDGVARTGATLARAAGVSPWLIHVYPLPAGTTELERMDGRWLDQQTEDLRKALAQQAYRTGLADLPGFDPERLRPIMGSPPREIVDLARQVKADLIVIGAQESGLLQRILLGSTADGVIRKAPCPVLVVRHEAAFPPARVEIPVDLSAVSAGAFRKGLGFLAELGVPLAETEALFVLNPFEVGGSLHFTPDQIERFAADELHRFVRTNSPQAPPRLARIRTGYPREEILAVLNERQADLAIVGTHGRSGFERLALGSVAAEVMHQAACNLLLIPPDATVEKEDFLRQAPPKGADRIFVFDEAEAPALR